MGEPKIENIWTEFFNPFQMIKGEIRIVYHDLKGNQYTIIYDIKKKLWYVVEHSTDKRSYTCGCNQKIPKRIKRAFVGRALRKLKREWKEMKEGTLGEFI